jgi:hypothetical protein
MLQQVYQHVAQMRVALDVKNRRVISDEERAAIGGGIVGRDVTTEYYDRLSHYEMDCVCTFARGLGKSKEFSRLSQRKKRMG